jgi:hypothetical protein
VLVGFQKHLNLIDKISTRNITLQNSFPITLMGISYSKLGGSGDYLVQFLFKVNILNNQDIK